MDKQRRSFLAKSLGYGTAIVSGSLVATPRVITSAAAKDQDTLVENWMNGWMTKEDRDVVGPLHLSRFADPIYFLLKQITWKPNPDQAGYDPVTAPVGFVTDFASIPRIFWTLLRPDGLYTYPAIIHDYLYWTQLTSKDTADNVFKFAMDDFGVAPATIAVIYEAVKLGGHSAWKENAKLKESGEQRFLSKFPNDPRTRWNDWKKNAGNFI